MDVRWKNLLMVLAVILVLLLVLNPFGFSAWPGERYLELVFSSEQLSGLDGSIGATDIQKMSVIRDGFRIVEEDNPAPIATTAELKIKQKEDGQWVLLIPNVASGKNYAYAINVTGYSIAAGQINGVTKEELVYE